MMTSDEPVVCSRMDADVEHEGLDNFLCFCRHMIRNKLQDKYLDKYQDKYLGYERILSGGANDLDTVLSAPGARSDMNIMVVLPNCCAISSDIHFVAPREISVFRIVTAGVHYGYALLVSAEYDVDLKHDQLFPDGLCETNDRRHGPAFYQEITVKRQAEDWFSSKTTAVNIDAAILGNKTFHKSEEINVKDVCSIDEVPCIRCPCWPSEASEWITRWRFHGCPTTSLVDIVVGVGCHFVPVAHKLSKMKDTEFRFSFSKAENILTNSWSQTQSYCYKFLKVVKGWVSRDRIDDDVVLCSYYFKTLMLWSCERRPPEFHLF